MEVGCIFFHWILEIVTILVFVYISFEHDLKCFSYFRTGKMVLIFSRDCFLVVDSKTIISITSKEILMKYLQI